MFVGSEASNPESKGIPKLCQFAPMTESEVKTIIMTMMSKSCEIDPIPIHIFKQLLPLIFPIVTKIVNISLSEGEFCNKWKVAVVWPLLKKIGLELNKSNYTPVSNLTFISKIIKKCMLHQLNIHCQTYNLLPDYQLAYHVRIIPVKPASYMINQWYPLGMWISISYVSHSAGFICHIWHCWPLYPNIYS